MNDAEKIAAILAYVEMPPADMTELEGESEFGVFSGMASMAAQIRHLANGELEEVSTPGGAFKAAVKATGLLKAMGTGLFSALVSSGTLHDALDEEDTK